MAKNKDCRLKDTEQNIDVINLSEDTQHLKTKLQKCGEVFVCNQIDFVLICGFCKQSFLNMSAFAEHIRGQHNDRDEMNGSCHAETSSEMEDYQIEYVDVSEPIYSASKMMVEHKIDLFEDEANPVEGFNSTDDEEAETADDVDMDKQKPNTRSRRSEGKRFPRPDLHYESNQAQISNKKTLKKLHDKKHDLRLTCRYCEAECADNEELEKHSQTHDREKPYNCKYCQKTFATTRNRNQHIKFIHIGHKPHKCAECPSTFGTKGKLLVHMLIHSMPGQYSCEICDKQFIHPSRKNAHMRIHTGEKPFQCELCGQKFILQSHLTEHMKRHNNTRNHECSLCGKRFYTGVILKEHMVSHSKDKPFECPDCGRAFSRQKVLKTHQKIHADVKQYSCNICDKSFSQFAGLYSHKKSHGVKLSAS